MAIELVIGDVAPDDSDAKYIPEPDNKYTVDYVIVSRFRRNRSRYVLGVTSEDGYNGDTAAFVQLSKGFLIWVADWTACRWGDVPDVPDPTPADSNSWRLLSDYWEPHTVELGPDGVTPIYRISGTYVYGHRRPNDNTGLSISIPQQPWVKDGFRRVLTTNDFKKGVIDSGKTSTFPVGAKG